MDVLDNNGNLTGIVKEKQEAKKNKDYTLGVHVWIRNSKNEILLQKRSIKKHSFPGMWDMTGGRVRAGESSITAIQREVSEELGIHLLEHEFQFLFRFPAQKNTKPMFLDTYLLTKDLDISELTLQKEEVEEVCYVSLSLVKNWYQENEQFVKQPYFLQLLEHLEESRI